jgi:hypothetical protein
MVTRDIARNLPKRGRPSHYHEIGDRQIIDQSMTKAMALIYATENASQRGTGGTTQAGCVATSLRLILHENLLVRYRTSKTWGGNQMPDHEVGFRQITAFLSSVPWMTIHVVADQLANLKTSGHYDRIVDATAKAR